MKDRKLLQIGVVGSVVAALCCFTPVLVVLFGALGLPWTGRGLYATILGGVLVGIGIALLLESRARVGGLVGLGLGGAVVINLTAGLAIAAWLLFSGADEVSSGGRIVLWLLVLFLVGLSTAEIVAHRRVSPDAPEPGG